MRVRGDDDAELPGRLFRGLKSYLGIRSHERFKVFDRQFRTVALVTLILTQLRETIEAHGDRVSDTLHIGRPVRFVGDDDANEIAMARLQEACLNAGFSSFTFYPEPVAASLSYLHTHRLAAQHADGGAAAVAAVPAAPGAPGAPGASGVPGAPGVPGASGVPAALTALAANGNSVHPQLADSDLLLTFDFGGGTLDLCLLESRGAQFRVLGTAGLPLGGNRVDQLIIKQLVFPELGEGSPIKSARHLSAADTVFPFYRYADYLLNWQMAYMMNQPDLMDTLFAGLRSGEEQQRKLGRLWRLIRGNYAYALLNATERAKARLSEVEQAAIYLPEIDLDIPIDRDLLARILEPVVEEIETAVTALLESHGVPRQRIHRVVCTGGSSQLLPVQALLEGLFPGRIVRFDFYRSIAGGLALANARGLRVRPPLITAVTVTAIRTPLIEPGSDLVTQVLPSLPLPLPDGCVLVVATKVISTAEGRLTGRAGDRRQLHDLVRAEAEYYLEPHASRYDIMLTIKRNWMFVNAGIDQSNAAGKLALWPRDPQASANHLWRRLREHVAGGAAAGGGAGRQRRHSAQLGRGGARHRPLRLRGAARLRRHARPVRPAHGDGENQPGAVDRRCGGTGDGGGRRMHAAGGGGSGGPHPVPAARTERRRAAGAAHQPGG